MRRPLGPTHHDRTKLPILQRRPQGTSRRALRLSASVPGALELLLERRTRPSIWSCRSSAMGSHQGLTRPLIHRQGLDIPGRMRLRFHSHLDLARRSLGVLFFFFFPGRRAIAGIIHYSVHPTGVHLTSEEMPVSVGSCAEILEVGTEYTRWAAGLRLAPFLASREISLRSLFPSSRATGKLFGSKTLPEASTTTACTPGPGTDARQPRSIHQMPSSQQLVPATSLLIGLQDATKRSESLSPCSKVPQTLASGPSSPLSERLFTS